MNYKTHIVGGLIAGTMVYSALNLPVYMAPVTMAISGVGSLIPDIDHTGSYLGRRMKITSKIVSKLTGHRGATHDPFIMAGVTFGLYILLSIFFPSLKYLKFIFISMYAGIFSHIFLDMFTKMGVPILYKLTGKYMSLGRVRVNSGVESFIRVILYVVLIVMQFKIITN